MARPVTTENYANFGGLQKQRLSVQGVENELLLCLVELIGWLVNPTSDSACVKWRQWTTLKVYLLPNFMYPNPANKLISLSG